MIDIDTILKQKMNAPHFLPIDDRQIITIGDAKQAIKEIVLKSLELAAENAKLKHEGFTGVDKQSITDTINQIKF